MPAEPAGLESPPPLNVRKASVLRHSRSPAQQSPSQHTWHTQATTQEPTPPPFSKRAASVRRQSASPNVSAVSDNVALLSVDFQAAPSYANRVASVRRKSASPVRFSEDHKPQSPFTQDAVAFEAYDRSLASRSALSPSDSAADAFAPSFSKRVQSVRRLSSPIHSPSPSAVRDAAQRAAAEVVEHELERARHMSPPSLDKRRASVRQQSSPARQPSPVNYLSTPLLDKRRASVRRQSSPLVRVQQEEDQEDTSPQPASQLTPSMQQRRTSVRRQSSPARGDKLNTSVSPLPRDLSPESERYKSPSLDKRRASVRRQSSPSNPVRFGDPAPQSVAAIVSPVRYEPAYVPSLNVRDFEPPPQARRRASVQRHARSPQPSPVAVAAVSTAVADMVTSPRRSSLSEVPTSPTMRAWSPTMDRSSPVQRYSPVQSSSPVPRGSTPVQRASSPQRVYASPPPYAQSPALAAAAAQSAAAEAALATNASAPPVTPIRASPLTSPMGRRIELPPLSVVGARSSAADAGATFLKRLTPSAAVAAGSPTAGVAVAAGSTDSPRSVPEAFTPLSARAVTMSFMPEPAWTPAGPRSPLHVAQPPGSPTHLSPSTVAGPMHVVTDDPITLHVVTIGMVVRVAVRTQGQTWALDASKYVVAELMFADPSIPTLKIFQLSEDELYSRTVLPAFFPLAWQMTQRLQSAMQADWTGDNLRDLLQNLRAQLRTVDTCYLCCLVCDREVPFPAQRPVICNNQMCIGMHAKCAAEPDLVQEIKRSTVVMDVMLSLTASAAGRGPKQMRPFPIEMTAPASLDDLWEPTVLTNGTSGDVARVAAVLQQTPTVARMAACKTVPELRQLLDQTHPLSYQLIRWIIASCPSVLRPLRDIDEFSNMKTPYQFRMLCDSPERTLAFERLKAQHGSFYAFTNAGGTAMWHSVMRSTIDPQKCLGEALHGSMQTVSGAGIYLSRYLSLALRPGADGGNTYPNSAVCKGNWFAVALCEVVNFNGQYLPTPYYVVPTADHVSTRIMFVFSDVTDAKLLEADAHDFDIHRIEWL
eukprot:TRINITY_DN8200_c0_g1_i2.p1 TRINITY_DN8200_c0_g1~~TRINITY_DN8200_c0_g1_i2.p1  ORF type:complete len:1043 (-),score=219.57 TRINITY_DN8200_c0_g1_i2:17-3145(-)